MAEVTTIDDLYALPPSEFVAARDALVKILRAQGDKEQAAAVKALRRPSAGAAALNVAARRRPDLVDGALAAAAALREATESAVGGSAADLRTATADERAATKALLDEAETHLETSGGDLHQRMAATLRAAAFDEELAVRLRRGVLSTDHQASGFDFASGFEIGAAPPRSPRRPKVAPAPAPAGLSSADDPKAETQARADAKRRRELVKQVARLEGRAARLALVADEAEQAAREARAEADAARSHLDESRRELDALS